MPSLRKAINDKCRECIYDPISGNGSWRNQVLGCTATACPLFDYRPTPDGKAANLPSKTSANTYISREVFNER